MSSSEQIHRRQLDLPSWCRVAHITSLKDNGGLPTFACLETAARYQGYTKLYGLAKHASLTEEGGCEPFKVNQVLSNLGYTGQTEYYLDKISSMDDVLLKALAANKIPIITDHGPGRYKCSVLTSVCVLHLDPDLTGDESVCLYDPSFKDVEWTTRKDFYKRARGEGKSTWILVLDRPK